MVSKTFSEKWLKPRPGSGLDFRVVFLLRSTPYTLRPEPYTLRPTPYAATMRRPDSDAWPPRTIPPRKVDIRLPGKGNSNSRGARPVY